MQRPNDLLPDWLYCGQSIYHYTSSSGLLGTLEKHALWATEAFGLNDVAELRHGWRFIRTWLEAQDADDEVVQDLLKRVPADDDPKIALGVFMCCASTLKDDASQWRLYADSARGYAIELDPSRPLGVLARSEVYSEGETLRRGRESLFGTMIRDTVSVSPWLYVLYSDEEKRHALEDLHDLARFALKEAHEASEAEKSDDAVQHLYDAYAEQASSGLATLAQCMKTDAFSGESEVRAIATFEWSDDHSYFRGTPYGVVRYVDLIAAPGPETPRGVLTSKSDPPNLPVTGLRLGPAQVVQNSEGATKALLRRYGYLEKVYTSSAALR